MRQSLGQLATWCLKAADMLLLLAALGLTIIANYAPEAQMSATHYALDFLSTRVKISNVLFCLAMLCVWHSAFRWLQLYEPQQWRTGPQETLRLAQALLIAALALLATAQAGRWPTVNVLTVACFALLGAALTGGLRWMSRAYLRRAHRRGRNLKTLLIIGGGARAGHFIRRLREESGLGYRLLGYLESDPLLSRNSLEGVAWRGPVENLARLVNSEIVDEVVIALPIKSHYAQIGEVLAVLEEQGLAAYLLSDFFPQKLARYQALEWRGMPLLSLQTAPPNSWRTEIKRVLDFTLAVALLILCAPLLLLIALFIKLDSPGPALFVQERMGYNKRRFRMFKFRTMTLDAEAQIDALEHLNERAARFSKSAATRASRA